MSSKYVMTIESDDDTSPAHEDLDVCAGTFFETDSLAL